MQPEVGRELQTFRCICFKQPILAVIKADEEDKPFVHLRVYKQTRIFGEIVFTFGEMHLKCRECYRWHRIRIVRGKATMEKDVKEPL